MSTETTTDFVGARLEIFAATDEVVSAAVIVVNEDGDESVFRGELTKLALNRIIAQAMRAVRAIEALEEAAK
jgi:hypothetical protein